MSRIQVVENPRRKRRKSRRSLSAAQIAAGFGGRGRMRGRKRRRNPLMASLAANPRRRRVSRRRRRYSNPSLGGFKFGGILGQVMAGVSVAAGIFAVRQAPALITKATGWTPTNIYLQTGVKLAVGIVGGMLVKKVLGEKNAQGFTAGAVGMALYDLANEVILRPAGLGSYVETPTYVPSLSGYETGNPPGMFGNGAIVPEMAV